MLATFARSVQVSPGWPQHVGFEMGELANCRHKKCRKWQKAIQCHLLTGQVGHFGWAGHFGRAHAWHPLSPTHPGPTPPPYGPPKCVVVCDLAKQFLAQRWTESGTWNPKLAMLATFAPTCSLYQAVFSNQWGVWVGCGWPAGGVREVFQLTPSQTLRTCGNLVQASTQPPPPPHTQDPPPPWATQVCGGV